VSQVVEQEDADRSAIVHAAMVDVVTCSSVGLIFILRWRGRRIEIAGCGIGIACGQTSSPEVGDLISFNVIVRCAVAHTEANAADMSNPTIGKVGGAGEFKLYGCIHRAMAGLRFYTVLEVATEQEHVSPRRERPIRVLCVHPLEMDIHHRPFLVQQLEGRSRENKTSPRLDGGKPLFHSRREPGFHGPVFRGRGHGKTGVGLPSP